MHKERLEQAEQSVAALLAEREDRWYPVFHIAAAGGWINDPNGLSYVDGRYQVYFQHNPYGSKHANMHWGHVSSEDMVTWRREPIALAPSVLEDRDGVFSGSAVVADDGNLVAYFTGHRWRNGVNEDEGNLQVQCIATSQDGGITFEKKGVIVECPEGLLHFRDPKVWQIGDTWYMVFGACSAQERGQVWLYTSTDMLNWTFDRVIFEDPDPNVFMPECPDLFPLGDKWVMMYCPMGPEPVGYQSRNGHNAGYVVGNWEPGGDFEATTEYRPMDWGHQFYAPQSFEAPDGRRIVYGWMGSFTVPIPTQEDNWCGQMTVPRELTLDSDDHLRAVPIRELTQLRQDTVDFGSFELGLNEDKVLLEDGDAVEVELDVDLTRTTSERVSLHVHQTPDGRSTFVAYDDLARRIVIDRRHSGHGDRGYRAAPYETEDRLRLRVLIDRGSVEVFADDGREVVTSFSFPGEGPRAITLSSESGTIAVDTLRVHRLGTIWAAPDR